MKSILLALIVAATFVFGACNKETKLNEPAAGNPSATLMKAADQMNLSTDQMAFLDEMFYLGEDLSVLLSPAQLSAFNSVITDITPQIMGGDRTDGLRGFVDMDAVMYYNLLIKANPDMDQATKDAIRALIVASAQKRARILKENPNADPARLRNFLQTEHDALIASINALLTRDQYAAAQALKLRIEAAREAQRERMMELRLTRQLQEMTRILGLTERQQAAIKEILKNQDKAANDLMTQFRGKPEELRAALQQLQERVNLAIAKLLTPEQVAKWKRWKNG